MSRSSPGRPRTEVQAVVQTLESLARAGVTHLPKRGRTSSGKSGKSSVVAVEPPAAEGAVPPSATRKAAKADAPIPAQAAVGNSRKERLAALDIIRQEVAGCELCTELATTRTQTVFGVGPPKPRLVFMGEAPGADEDRQGEPFVGRAGQLLNKIIEACTFRREDVNILNTLKCRPPGTAIPCRKRRRTAAAFSIGSWRCCVPSTFAAWGGCCTKFVGHARIDRPFCAGGSTTTTASACCAPITRPTCSQSAGQEGLLAGYANSAGGDGCQTAGAVREVAVHYQRTDWSWRRIEPAGSPGDPKRFEAKTRLPRPSPPAAPAGTARREIAQLDRQRHNHAMIAQMRRDLLAPGFALVVQEDDDRNLAGLFAGGQFDQGIDSRIAQMSRAEHHAVDDIIRIVDACHGPFRVADNQHAIAIAFERVAKQILELRIRFDDQNRGAGCRASSGPPRARRRTCSSGESDCKSIEPVSSAPVKASVSPASRRSAACGRIGVHHARRLIALLRVEIHGLVHHRGHDARNAGTGLVDRHDAREP